MSDAPPRQPWGWRARAACLLVAAALLAVTAGAAWYWRDDMLRTTLDPKQPYQTYAPPPAPNYALASAWALLPAPAPPGARLAPVDVFFVHPTTFDGGRDWNGPIDDPRARQRLLWDVLPNYAAPFARAGRVWAPRYRQASLYATLTLRDDARDARRFAYADVLRAFDSFLERTGGRPFILVGVEQGGLIAERLAQDSARDPALKARLVAAYLIDTTVPASAHAPGSALPACARREEARCVLAYQEARAGDFTARDRLVNHAAMWKPNGGLEAFAGEPLCVNPLTGSVEAPSAPEAANRGAAAAARLEWGARPALLAGQVSAACREGLLRTSRPRSPALHRSGGITDHMREPAFNLFWADLEADALGRVRAFMATPRPAPPITQVVEVPRAFRPR